MAELLREGKFNTLKLLHMSLAIWYNWKKSRRERTGGFFLEKRIFKILYEADI